MSNGLLMIRWFPYGSNGTAKSAVCKAIFAKANGSAETMDELRQYGIGENDEEHQPDVYDILYSNEKIRRLQL